MAKQEQEVSLRESLDAAVAEVEQPEVEQQAAPEQPTEVPGYAETPTKAPNEASAPEQSEVDTGATPSEEGKDAVPTFVKDKATDVAPASWKGDAKKVWADLPEAARAEVIRRERQVDSTLRETAQARQIVEDMQRTIQPYQQRLQELGASPAQMFSSLMEADRILATAPMQQRATYLAGLIKQYGIDIQALDSALAGQPVQASPQYDIEAKVQQLLAQRLAPIEQRMQQEQEAQQQEIQHTVESMATDPRFPYFQDVRDDMADLIEMRANRGIYISMEQAYAIATGGNPAVQQSQQQQVQRQQASSAHAAAQRAKGAAVSVGGSPASVRGGTDATNLRGTIEGILDNL